MQREWDNYLVKDRKSPEDVAVVRLFLRIIIRAEVTEQRSSCGLLLFSYNNNCKGAPNVKLPFIIVRPFLKESTNSAIICLMKWQVKSIMQSKHFDESGNAVMVDITAKESGKRTARASGSIKASGEVLDAVKAGTAKKGDVLALARVAGIMAAKRCSDIIPLAHPISLTKCAVDFIIDEEKNVIIAECTVKTEGKTGAEMEALTGVSIALLTIYDMCKSIDKRMCVGDVHLISKQGGKSGNFSYAEEASAGE